VPRYLPLLLMALGCVSCSIHTPSSDIPTGFAGQAIFDGAEKSAGAAQNTSANQQHVHANTYQLSFGPQIVSVRAAYRDNADPYALNGDDASRNLQRYFDLRATSALAGTKVLGEGEMAYNLQQSLDGNVRPAMFRFGLKHQWNSLSYGADYKSVQKGFTPLGGAATEQSRDDVLFWSEHRSGPFKLRATIGEAWEQADVAEFRLTRTAATVLQINRPGWGGSLTTSYGLSGPKSGAEDNAVLTGKLATSFRPSASLVFEPSFTMNEERNWSTGTKSQTPASRFSLTYAPAQSGFRLSGGTSFSRTINRDSTGDVSTHGATASLDWRLGSFLGQNDSLSFKFNYNRQFENSLRNQSNYSLTSTVNFKIAGF
jgi:hypothetical protein